MKKYRYLLIVLLKVFSLNAQSLQITDFKSSVSCDYLVVCPDSFLSCGIKLAAYRNSYKFDDVEKAMTVALSAIEQEFPVPDTCPRVFSTWYALKYAAEHWIKAPHLMVEFLQLFLKHWFLRKLFIRYMHGMILLKCDLIRA